MRSWFLYTAKMCGYTVFFWSFLDFLEVFLKLRVNGLTVQELLTLIIRYACSMIQGAFLLVMAAVFLYGCGGSKPAEPDTPPFSLSNPRVLNGVLRIDLAYNESQMPDLAGHNSADFPVGLLALYCGDPAYDIRKVGSVRGRGYGQMDPEAGSEVLYSTIADDDHYYGALWYWQEDSPAWRTRGQVSISLMGDGVNGKVESEGHLLIAVVSGTIGDADFTLLSKPVSMAYGESMHKIPAAAGVPQPGAATQDNADKAAKPAAP